MGMHAAHYGADFEEEHEEQLQAIRDTYDRGEGHRADCSRCADRGAEGACLRVFASHRRPDCVREPLQEVSPLKRWREFIAAGNPLTEYLCDNFGDHDSRLAETSAWS